MQIPTKEAISPYVDCPRRTPPVRSMKDNYPSVHIENLHDCHLSFSISYTTVADGLHQ